jgi:hypothetical protein
MYRVRSLPTKLAKRRAATFGSHVRLRFPLGSHVRLRLREATGVVVGYSPGGRVRVQWDDSVVVTHCLSANLELAQ